MKYERCNLYLAEFQSLGVLPFHLPTGIFGVSYQTPVKYIVCPCEEVATINKTNDFNYNPLDKDDFQMRHWGRGDQGINNTMACILLVTA